MGLLKRFRPVAIRIGWQRWRRWLGFVAIRVMKLILETQLHIVQSFCIEQVCNRGIRRFLKRFFHSNWRLFITTSKVVALCYCIVLCWIFVVLLVFWIVVSWTLIYHSFERKKITWNPSKTRKHQLEILLRRLEIPLQPSLLDDVGNPLLLE
jgi:hypothetical protein